MQKKQSRPRWKYKNLSILFCSLVVAFILSRFEAFHSLLLHVGYLGYVGAFIAGIMFVSTFTVATSALILLILSESLSPIEIGLIAGLGAVVGDVTIFHYIRNDLSKECMDVYYKIDPDKHLKKLFHSKYFNWMLPVFGALIIASPFPDEMGISIMGLSKISTGRFIFLSYILNTIGIFLVISASVFIRP